MSERKNILKTDKSGNWCADCGGYVERDAEWLGEDEASHGWYMAHYRCEDCGNWMQVKEAE